MDDISLKPLKTENIYVIVSDISLTIGKLAFCSAGGYDYDRCSAKGSRQAVC